MNKVFLMLLLLFVAGCTVTTEQGAFDVESDRTGKVDKNGFPVFVGARYDRDVVLKQVDERSEIETELEAIASSRKTPSVDVDKKRNELLQKRLLDIARTHSDDAQAEIDAACQTDENGVVHCKGD